MKITDVIKDNIYEIELDEDLEADEPPYWNTMRILVQSGTEEKINIRVLYAQRQDYWLINCQEIYFSSSLNWANYKLIGNINDFPEHKL